ncbi:MAG: hypothetical protein Q8941_09020 [Bacteroidota bacterium]|nr:hypothetical protein [Bacteroidota bacterium]
MASASIDKIVGIYYLHSVRETASGFKLNADGTFQFFFTYGALDRYGSGNWTMEKDHVILQSRPWSGKDFALIDSSKSGSGITIRVTDKNPFFPKHVFASLKNGEDGSWQPPGDGDMIRFPDQELNVISLVFEYCPERFSFFPVINKEHNYFEFRLEPWIMEVFFNNFPLQIKKRVLIGKHPLLTGPEYIYEK